MKHDIVLGIVAVSLLSATAYAAPQAAPAPVVSVGKAASGGGKCASGKCGTEKIYAKTTLAQDPTGHLVRARDGKCGLTGLGHQVVQNDRDRMAQGVCGR